MVTVNVYYWLLVNQVASLMYILFFQPPTVIYYSCSIGLSISVESNLHERVVDA